MPLHLYLLQIPKPDALLLKDIVSKLPYHLQNKISRFRFIQDQWRALLSNLLMRKILSQELQADPDSIKIELSAYGKPFLQGKERQFNLSHAGDYIFFATDDTPIGIDIEQVRPLDDFENIVQTCLSIKEQKSWVDQDKKNQLEYFYELWTLKESYIKALGKGMSHSLQSFSINILEKSASLEQAIDLETSWYFKQYAFDDHYKAAVCAQHSHFSEQPTLISFSDLLEPL